MAQDGLYPKRIDRQRLAMVVAVIIVAAVVGGLLLVFSLAGRHGTRTAGQAVVKATLTSLATSQSYCDKTNMSWYAICSTHQDKVLNITKTINGGTFIINAVYADSNQVLLSCTQLYSANNAPARSHHSPMNVTLITQQGIQLPETSQASMFDAKAMFENDIFFFDASAVSPRTRTLNLHLQTPLQIGTATGSNLTASFSAPFHPGRIANLNQTVTVNGIAITLQKVVVTATETRLYVLSKRLQMGYTQTSPYSLTVGNVYVSRFNEAEPILSPGKSSPVSGIILSEDTSLMDVQGQWTLKITSGAMSGGSGNGTWIFHFTVPA